MPSHPPPSQPTRTSRRATCPSSWTPGRCPWRSSASTSPMMPASGSFPGTGCTWVRPGPRVPPPGPTWQRQLRGCRAAGWSPETHPLPELMPGSPARPPPGCPVHLGGIPRTPPGLPVPRPPRSGPAALRRVGPEHLLGEDAGLPVGLSSPSAPSALPLFLFGRGAPHLPPSPGQSFLPSARAPLAAIPLHPHLRAAHLEPAPCPHREGPGPRRLREGGGSLGFRNPQGQQL